MPSIIVSIAAHYVPRRVPFLADVLLAISEWQGRDVTVILDTNDLALRDDPGLQEALVALERSGVTLELDLAHGMAHPWHLTWWHKPRLREWSEQEGSENDLFVYIEDDIVVRQDNLDYFTRFLPAAKAKNCLPGLMRYEKRVDGTLMSADYRGYQLVQDCQRIELDGQPFVAPRFPYWAGFIMDRDLAREYFRSDWSDIVKADTKWQSHKNSCRVQSAWALTFENVPEGFWSRYVVPVDKDLRPLESCLVWHCADNYNVSQLHSFGTIRMDGVFRRRTLANKVRQTIWQAGALRRRIVDKVQRTIAG